MMHELDLDRCWDLSVDTVRADSESGRPLWQSRFLIWQLEGEYAKDPERHGIWLRASASALDPGLAQAGSGLLEVARKAGRFKPAQH